MKQFVIASFSDENYTRGKKSTDLPVSVYNSLRDHWPQFAGPYAFTVRVEPGSDLQREVFEYLAKYDKKPCWKMYPGIYSLKYVFQLRGENVFDEGDLDHCRYLIMCPAKRIAGEGGYLEEYRPKEINGRVYRVTDVVEGQYRDRLRLWADAGSIYGKVQIGTGPCSGRNACVDAGMREKMIAQNFQDVYFRPVEIRGESRRSKPLWQLWTDRILPPVLNELVETNGKPYVPGISPECYVQELYQPNVLHYRRSDLDAMGEFDFALTHELWGQGQRSPKMFVSKRVYEWFESQGLLEGFIPLVEE
ncbi:MAG: hypothetical protein U1F71_04785 [Verrucomicrobiaceae bacterium]